MRLKAAANIILAILCVFLSLEATARYYYFGLDGFKYRKMDSFHSIGRSGLIQLSKDPAISYELKPNVDGYFKMERFVTNSQGLRDQEYSLSKPPHAFRVAVVGASYVMGSGVEMEDTFHAVLENQLNRENKGMTYEFINMGVGGHSPWQSLAVVKRKALAYQPDLIFFAPYHSGYLYGPKRPRRSIPPVNHPFFDSYFKALVQLRIAARLNRSKREKGDADLAKREKVPKHIDEIFSELGAIQEKTGIPVCVLFLEHREDSFYLVKEMEAPARRYGLRLIDASEPFVRAGFPDHCAHPLDCHPNAAAHRVFARVIYDFLLKDHLLEKAGTRNAL